MIQNFDQSAVQLAPRSSDSSSSIDDADFSSIGALEFVFAGEYVHFASTCAIGGAGRFCGLRFGDVRAGSGRGRLS